MTAGIHDADHALAPARHCRVLGLIVLIAVLLIACDASVLGTAPSAVCTEVGVQCQLATGPLGVCERTRCPDNAAGPCYDCISQH